ncbi:uncharacterized protein M421DRAFT_11372, partial [Didymella exigua CBS 183.55]
MKASIVLFALQCITSAVFAQNSTLASGLDALPPCALTCLVTAASESPCQPTNSTCTCTNALYQSAVETCVSQSCTVKEGLTTKNATSTLCGVPRRDREATLNGIVIGLAVVSTLIVFTRIVGKMTQLIPNQDLGADDVCLLVTLCLSLTASTVISAGAGTSGLGRDIWTLEFQQITDFARWFYITQILYFAELPFLKLSLTFFYLRIFVGTGVTRLLWVAVAVNTAIGIAFTLACIFQCQPISHTWTSWDGVDTGGKCIDNNALAWANAAVSIAMDLVMLVIPLSQVAMLNMALKKKIAVSAMFVVGTFVTIVSVLRLQSLVTFSKSANPTWDQWVLTVWSIVEVNMGFICLCMPALRSILVRLLPEVFGST